MKTVRLLDIFILFPNPTAIALSWINATPNVIRYEIISSFNTFPSNIIIIIPCIEWLKSSIKYASYCSRQNIGKLPTVLLNANTTITMALIHFNQLLKFNIYTVSNPEQAAAKCDMHHHQPTWWKKSPEILAPCARYSSNKRVSTSGSRLVTLVSDAVQYWPDWVSLRNLHVIDL